MMAAVADPRCWTVLLHQGAGSQAQVLQRPVREERIGGRHRGITGAHELVRAGDPRHPPAAVVSHDLLAPRREGERCHLSSLVIGI